VLVVPNQAAGLLERHGFTRIQADANVLAIDRRGRRFQGAAAANRALLALGGPWRAVGALYWLRPIGWLEDRGYRWIARNRTWLSGLAHTAPELPEG